MDKYICLFTCFMVFLVKTGHGEEICCDAEHGCYDDKAPFENFPLPLCPRSLNLKMYTKSPFMIDRNSINVDGIPGKLQTDPELKNVFIIHGYMETPETNWVSSMKQAILLQNDSNVIVVDWTAGAGNIVYPQSAANIRTVGTEVGLIAKRLISAGYSRENLHCIGFSLGAHACGQAGKIVKFGRISGLSPSSPWFAGNPEAGLNPSCADFVDVIHTSDYPLLSIPLGDSGAIGDADFYPNGGGFMPGCSHMIAHGVVASSNLETAVEFNEEMWSTEHQDMAKEQLDLDKCSQYMAVEYYLSSLQPECNFEVSLCCEDDAHMPASCKLCEGNTKQKMGYLARKENLGLFYLATDPRAPFCLN